MESKSGVVKRQTKYLLVGCVLLGLVLRVFEVWSYTQSRPNDATRLVGDEPGYNNLALGLVHGTDFFSWPGRVPLYSVLLAGLHIVTGQSYDAITYLQALIGLAVVPLSYLLGRRVFPESRTPALIAAFLAATSYALIEHVTRIQSEILYDPVLLIAAIALWGAVARPSSRSFCLAGAAFGVSALVRPVLLFFPGALGLCLLAMRSGRRAALRGTLIFATAMGMVLLPWVVFTYQKHGALIPLQTSNAILWQGSPEYYHLLRDDRIGYQRVWREVIYGPGWQKHDPTSVAGDQWWTRRAIASIRSEPRTYARYFFEKLGTLWIGDPNADWANSQVFNLVRMRRWFSVRELFMITTSRGLPVVALAGCLLLWRRWRRLLPLYAILGYVTLLHAATHAEFRLSSPFQPILMVLIGGAVTTVLDRRRLTRTAPNQP